MPEHAQTSGAVWWSTACKGGHLYPPACITPPYPSFTYDAEDGLVQAFPFVVYASETCTPVANDIERAQSVVRERFRLGRGRAIENALWGGGSGVTGVFEQLVAAGGAANPVVNVLAASANPVEALSLLEQQGAASSYNGPIMIHARPRMAAYLAKYGAFRTKVSSDPPGVRYTWNETMVVFGPGYSGNDTTGSAPTSTTEAMYVTGRILLWEEPGDLWVPGDVVLDRTLNQRGIYGARAYALGVECLAAATVVTRT